MKLFAITFALAGTVAASAGAQALPRSGTVYQQTQANCVYRRSTNSVGDVIFGRGSSAANCQDVYSRQDGAWYQVGVGANNNSIYERRTTDRRGNLVIQRARRNRNGTFTILNTRVATSNDRQWKREEKAREKARQKAYKQQQKDYNRIHR
ncbi:MAG: hypothetical protein ACRENK_01105 [Gemmatimonadaceae bacterium]